MAKYTDHSKFAYMNYDEIQDGINAGTIGPYDLILCKDTREFILIKDDLSLASINSKVYRFSDVASAEKALNESMDTYEGQLVAIVYDSSYAAYIVNRNKGGKFYVTPLSSNGDIDYNTLGNRPITNLTGTLDSPIVVESLENGIYKITGQYQLQNGAQTVYLSMSSNLFLVQHTGDSTYIKRISPYDIYDYSIDESGTMTRSSVPTTTWLEQQGYASEAYVDKKIAALNFITKQEVEEYINNTVMGSISTMVDKKIDEKINEKFEATTSQEIIALFNN